MEADWFPENQIECEYNLGLNNHLVAEGAKTPKRVEDSERAKDIALSYKSPAGAIAAIIKCRFLITSYT